MGPFELADYVGLDTTKFIIDGKNLNFFEFIKNMFLNIVTLDLSCKDVKSGFEMLHEI